MNNVIDFINTNRDRYVDELKAYLAIPSISALPEHAPDVKRAAEWSADEMRRIGMQNVKLIETPGFPVVRSEEHTSELQSPYELVGRLLLEKKKIKNSTRRTQNKK